MKVAVLIATYNGENYIKEQIESILNQDGDFELSIYVNDDCSGDGTQKILQEYSEKYPNVFNITSNKMGSAPKNFLHLIDNVEIIHDYYLFSDQDDVWVNDKILRSLNALKSSKKNLYGSAVRKVDSNLNDLDNIYCRHPRYIKASDFYICCFQGSTICMSQKFFRDIKNIKKDEVNIFAHDHFAFILASISDDVVYDDVPTVLYRMHDSNVSLIKGNLNPFVIFKNIPNYRRRFKEYVKLIEHVKNYKYNCLDTTKKARINYSLRLKYFPIRLIRYITFRLDVGLRKEEFGLLKRTIWKIMFVVGLYYYVGWSSSD